MPGTAIWAFATAASHMTIMSFMYVSFFNLSQSSLTILQLAIGLEKTAGDEEQSFEEDAENSQVERNELDEDWKLKGIFI